MDGAATRVAAGGAAAEGARGLGRDVRRLSESVRELAGEVASTQQTPWRSLAADAFRDQVTDLTASLRRAADDVALAAGALDAHADRVGRRVETARALLAVVQGAAGDGLDDAEVAARAALDQLVPW